MKGLFILCYIAATASAGKLPGGYEYQNPSSGSISGTFQPNFIGASGGYGYNTPPSNSYLEPQQNLAPIITKSFHIHSAPEEQAEEGQTKTINLGPGRKHYRVVFIKAPAESQKAAHVSVTQGQNQEKTVIYVLSQKPDAAEIQTSIQAARNEPTKPEVFFIKYKTAEEAAHAQQQIQAQYDRLGGTSQVVDEGIAPVSSVIGALGSSSLSAPSGTGIAGDFAPAPSYGPPSASYLPPN